MPVDALPLVIGLGNEHRRDDGCGLEVVRTLQKRLGVEARLVEGGEDATDLLDLWEGAETVYVVDAVQSGRPAGTIHRFEVDRTTTLAGLPVTSTHGLSLGEAVALGRALGRFPGRLIVFGIEVTAVAPGAGLTPPVQAAVEEVMWRIAEELAVTEGPADA